MVRLGIMGCGSIAGRMAAVIGKTDGVELKAVAARDWERAKAFGEAFGAEKAYGSYAELARDHEVDAVYIATIHPAHAACIRLCLENGKAVLCEKPMAMSAREAEAMVALAREKGVLLVEGLWTRFLPAWKEIKRLINDGAIGRIRYMQTDFSVDLPFDPESRIYDLEKGGGALLDVGVYAFHVLLYTLGIQYETMKAVGRLSPTGSDCFASTLLRYPDGCVAEASCGCDMAGPNMAHIHGEKGHIDVPAMFGATSFTLYRQGKEAETFSFDTGDGFQYELMEFARLVEEGALESESVPLADTLAVSRLIDEAMVQIRA